MTIPDLRAENHEFHDELMERAAREFHKNFTSGNAETIRFQLAFIAIGAWLAEEDGEPDFNNPGESLPYLQQHYLKATDKLLPFGARTDDAWNELITEAKAAFRFRKLKLKLGHDPKPEEKVVAVLRHDPLVEFKPTN